MNSTPWPDVLNLFEYWKQYPPVHIAVNQLLVWLGAIKPTSQRRAQISQTEEKIAAQAKVVSFKRLPKYMEEFAQEVVQGKHAVKKR